MQLRGAIEKSDWVSSGNRKRLMIEATRGGGGRKGDRRVYFERPLPDYGALKQRQALRHRALFRLLQDQTRMGKRLAWVACVLSAASPWIGREKPKDGPQGQTHA